MKKSKVLLTALFCITMAVDSCKKAETTASLSSLQKLKSLEMRYSKRAGVAAAKTTQSKPPSPGGTVLADALGAMGTAILGPIAAAAGGICGSVSYVWGFGFDMVSPTPIPGSSNPNNPYDVYGNIHNQTCMYLMANYNAATSTDDLLNVTMDYGVLNFPTEMSGKISNDDVAKVVTILDQVVKDGGSLEDELKALEDGGYITSDENLLEDEYLNTFTSVQDPINYSIAAEKIINEAQDISNESKMKMLVSMTVARNSQVLWQEKP